MLLGGWAAGIEVLKRIVPDYVAMVPSTAACLLLMSAGLLFRLRQGPEPSFPLGLWISGAVAATVLANVLRSLPSDLLKVGQAVPLDWSGEAMAAGTQVEFLASVYCLAALSHERLWNERAYSLVATSGLLVGAAAVVGYVFRSGDSGEVVLFDAMALHAAAGFVLLHAAFLLAQPRGAWVSVLLGRGSGSARARKLFPLALATPLALCFAALVMTEAGLFSANLRLALLAITMMALSASIVLLNAEKENQAEHLAQHDPLTGLANRARFNDCLERAMAKTGRRGRKVGLVLIDLDHFKATNDTLGHPVGDGVLSAMADRLKLTLAPHDTAARVGGDEFAAILDDRSSREEIERDARCIHRALCRPLTVQGHRVAASASLGVAMCPDDASDSAGLIRRADHALYDAKARGRRCLVVLGDKSSAS